MDNDFEKILLHNECIRMIRRPSKIIIINTVMEKLFNIKNYNKNIQNNKNYSFYEIVLTICGCLDND